MALAELDFEQLAARIDMAGMGSRLIRNMATASHKRVARPHELRYIADACGISPGFFTVDFRALESDDTEDGRVERLERQLAQIVDRLDGIDEDLSQMPLTADDQHAATQREARSRTARTPGQTGKAR